MAHGQPLTRDGNPWTPRYIDAINAETCIGCGRCYKVCSHDVLQMMGIDEDGKMVASDDDDAMRMVMTIAHKGNCIGCYACATVCGTKSMTHVTLEQGA